MDELLNRFSTLIRNNFYLAPVMAFAGGVLTSFTPLFPFKYSADYWLCGRYGREKYQTSFLLFSAFHSWNGCDFRNFWNNCNSCRKAYGALFKIMVFFSWDFDDSDGYSGFGNF